MKEDSNVSVAAPPVEDFDGTKIDRVNMIDGVVADQFQAKPRMFETNLGHEGFGLVTQISNPLGV
ncbi:MAG: hypothetical protein QMB94_02395, partial [Phycisphaerales bacterium]